MSVPRPKEDQMVTSVRQMLETANAAVPKITPDQASDMIKKGNTLVVDVRDAPEVSASGKGAVAELVGIEGGVVSGVINLESSGVEASGWRPRHDEPYHEV